MADLMTIQELAYRMKLSKRTLYRYRHRGMPGPVVPHDPHDANQPALFSWAAIEPWAEELGIYDAMVGLATPLKRGMNHRHKKAPVDD